MFHLQYILYIIYRRWKRFNFVVNFGQCKNDISAILLQFLVVMQTHMVTTEGSVRTLSWKSGASLCYITSSVIEILQSHTFKINFEIDCFGSRVTAAAMFLTTISGQLNDSNILRWILIKGFRSYFKVVVLAPSFWGEGSLKVIRDLNECIFSYVTTGFRINNSLSIIRHLKSAARGVCAHKTPLK